MRYLALISFLFLMGCPSEPMEEVVESNDTSDAMEEQNDLSGINPDEVEVDEVEIEEIEADLDNTEWVDKQELDFKEDGMVYQKGTEVPFSGGIKSFYENGELEQRYLVQNGIKHGPYEKYFENGNLNRKCAYKEGNFMGISKNGTSLVSVQVRYNIWMGKRWECLPGGMRMDFDRSREGLTWLRSTECGCITRKWAGSWKKLFSMKAKS